MVIIFTQVAARRPSHLVGKLQRIETRLNAPATAPEVPPPLPDNEPPTSDQKQAIEANDATSPARPVITSQSSFSYDSRGLRTITVSRTSTINEDAIPRTESNEQEIEKLSVRMTLYC